MRFTAETRGCLKCENFFPAYISGGKYDRTDDFDFLPIVFRRARERR